MTIKEKILDAFDKYTLRLKDIVLTYNDVVNSCTSTATNLPLSASQGKILQDQITVLQNQIVDVSTFSTYIETGESKTFYFPVFSRAYIIGWLVRGGLHFTRWCYVDCRPNSILTRDIYSDVDSNGQISYQVDGENENCVIFSNSHTRACGLFFIIPSGQVSIIE